ncbi:MAG: membrane protein insertase YidC, partial [Nocardiopsaceae bacterium]|nr:membrane protein insertase YidC [Nocardiopsaceae bacterium]
MSILNPLFEAVAWVLIKIHAGLAVPFGADSGLTWVLSIVILVAAMRLIMLPLFVKQVKSQQRMQAHMPKLREIQKRYKHDKQRQQEEMMKFYKENSINPLGGCLPLVAQLPVFWSLFNVLRAIAEWKGGTPQYGIPVSVVQSALHARVFGASLADKVLFTGGISVSVESKIVILVAVAISAVTTFLTMRQSQKRGMLQQPTADPDNPAANMQKYMMYIAPLFALTGLYWQFGLVIYWVTTNVWTLVQQHFLFRNLPPVDSTTADAATAPATGTKGAAAAKGAPAKPGTAKSGAAKAGTAQAGTAKAGTARAGTARGGTAKPGAAAKSGAAKPGTGAAKTGAAEPGSASAKSPAAKSDAGAKSGTVRTGSAKTDAAANADAAAEPAASERKAPAQKAQPPKDARRGPSGQAAASRKAPMNGAAPAGKPAKDSANGGGARGRLRFGKGKAEPEPEPAAQTTTVRQQPVRQSRSK